jgi:hypothetical protein
MFIELGHRKGLVFNDIGNVERFFANYTAKKRYLLSALWHFGHVVTFLGLALGAVDFFWLLVEL